MREPQQLRGLSGVATTTYIPDERTTELERQNRELRRALQELVQYMDGAGEAGPVGEGWIWQIQGSLLAARATLETCKEL